jgi:hypothetical protein
MPMGGIKDEKITKMEEKLRPKAQKSDFSNETTFL